MTPDASLELENLSAFISYVTRSQPAEASHASQGRRARRTALIHDKHMAGSAHGKPPVWNKSWPEFGDGAAFFLLSSSHCIYKGLGYQQIERVS